MIGKRVISLILLMSVFMGLAISSHTVTVAELNPRYTATGNLVGSDFHVTIELNDIDLTTVAGFGLQYDQSILTMKDVALSNSILKAPLLTVPNPTTNNDEGYYILAWRANDGVKHAVDAGTTIATFKFEFKSGKSIDNLVNSSLSAKPWIHREEIGIMNEELWDVNTNKYHGHSYISSTGKIEMVDLDFEFVIDRSTPTPTPTGYSITATANTGGTVTDLGVTYVAEGANKTYTISPDSGYRINSVTVNGKNQPGFSGTSTKTYTFSNVRSNQVIDVVFAKSSTTGPDDPPTGPTDPSRPPIGGGGIVVYPTASPSPSPAPLTSDHYRYIYGYAEDGTIRPDNNISREEVAAIFYRLLNSDIRKSYRRSVSNFPDVESGRWSSMSIATVQNYGVIVGYEDGTFLPGNTITRAEFATIIVRFFGVSQTAQHSFADVNGHWAEQYIATAVQRGWITGYPDGTFAPDRPISRAEVMALTNRVLERNVDAQGLLQSILVTWPDIDSGHWAYYEVMEATISHLFARRYTGSTVENWTGSMNDINFDIN